MSDGSIAAGFEEENEDESGASVGSVGSVDIPSNLVVTDEKKSKADPNSLHREPHASTEERQKKTHDGMLALVEGYRAELFEDAKKEGKDLVSPKDVKYDDLYRRLIDTGNFTPLTAADAIYDLEEREAGNKGGETTTSAQSSSFNLHIQIPQCHPFVKWAGGKTQLLPELERYIPDKFTRYYEPFLGGGAFFFYLVSSKQLNFTPYLSDVNKELINAYRIIKDDVEALIELLRIHEKGYKVNPNEYYYKLRAESKPLTDVESAARFITLNKTCYNGLHRVNGDGLFNVPIGKFKKSPLICDAENLRNVSMALRHTNAHLLVSNYQKILELAREDDFIYVDPPYKPTSLSANFTSYTRDGFADKDQIALYETFKKLDRKGCKILLSNSDTPFIRELYGDFKEYTSQVSGVLRAINCKAAKRSGHMELLIRNYESIGSRLGLSP